VDPAGDVTHRGHRERTVSIAADGGARIRSARSITFLLAQLVLAMLLCLGLRAAPAAAAADVVVIGNPQLDISSISVQMVADLYLGRAVQLNTGQRVEVVDLPPGHPVRDEFYSGILGRDPDQIRAYWAKRIFTGKGTPPLVRGDEAAVVRWVAAEPGRIGYVSRSAVTDSVQVLLSRNGTK
jgi:ABC-type phosphate transport system substrate-binding protein